MQADWNLLAVKIADALDALRSNGHPRLARELADTWLPCANSLPENGAPPPAPDSQSAGSGPKAAPAGPEAENNAQNNRYAAEVAMLGGVSDTLANRQQDYGPNPFNNETTGKAWEAILEARWQVKLPGPIDALSVALMMSALKLTRAATPFGFRDDNYVDMVGYAMIAHRCDPRSQQRKVEP
jgi:hypothetical protein